MRIRDLPGAMPDISNYQKGREPEFKEESMVNQDIYKRALFLLGESYATLDYIYNNIKLPDGVKEYINNQLNEIAVFTSHVNSEEE